MDVLKNNFLLLFSLLFLSSSGVVFEFIQPIIHKDTGEYPYVVFHKNNNLFAVISRSKFIKIYKLNIDVAEEYTTINYNSDTINEFITAQWHPNRDLLITFSNDYEIAFWQIQEGASTKLFSLKSNYFIKSIQWHLDKETIWMVSANKISIWKFNEHELIPLENSGELSGIIDHSFNSKDGVLAVAFEHNLELWKKVGQKLKKIYEIPGNTKPYWDSTGTFLAILTTSKINLYKLEQGILLFVEQKDLNARFAEMIWRDDSVLLECMDVLRFQIINFTNINSKFDSEVFSITADNDAVGHFCSFGRALFVGEKYFLRLYSFPFTITGIKPITKRFHG